eukprot:m.118194 g.118194  ORF g.118194 m.118194 type:complete len:68 (-) comp13647_c0_seq5:1249-1452(-)
MHSLFLSCEWNDMLVGSDTLVALQRKRPTRLNLLESTTSVNRINTQHQNPSPAHTVQNTATHRTTST